MVKICLYSRVYGSGAAGPANKPPKLELDGKKWVVEYFKVSRRVLLSVLRIRIRDPGSGAFLTPGCGTRDGQNIKMWIRDERPDSYFRELRNNFLS
jgi:hypothetical protein